MAKADFSSSPDSTLRNDKLAFLLPLFRDNTLAPLTYLDFSHRKIYDEPEEKLLCALLNDAVYCFQHHFGARSRAGMKLFFAAEQWLMQSDDDWPFSFENVCQHLDIEPSLLRGALKHWRNCRLISMATWRCRTDKATDNG
jgi:hypothetical protein